MKARWILAVLLALALVNCFVFHWLLLLWVPLIGFTFYFFRDPERETPSDPLAVVAAADGVVVDVVEMVEPEVLKVPMTRIAIFLSVFDVHTNRAPITGTVTYSHRTSDSSWMHATRSDQSERMPHVGLLKERRRSSCGKSPGPSRAGSWHGEAGDGLGKGERFGMIRFGSRTRSTSRSTASSR